jgi:PPM family protein phosphatase
MKLRVGASSDIGQARERNEDRFLTSPPLYVVADGMGGHRGGEVAAAIAVDVLSRRDETPLLERVRNANRAVFDRQAGDRSVAGMGTTVTAAEIEGPSIRLAHVGDSRAYLLRDGELRMLTEDHTLVQQMVEEGKITPAEAHDHPQRNILTRVVGVDPEVDVDEHTVQMRDGDRLLLCTDGLTSMMRDESVREILQNNTGDPQQAAEALIGAANRAGGLDNITVVVLDFGPGDGVELLGPVDGNSFGRAEVGGSPVAARSANAPVSDGGSGGRVDATADPRPARLHPQPEETGMIETVEAQPKRKRWPRVLVWVGIAFVVIAAGLAAFRIYLDRQWYVGVANGHVAVFRGLPGDVLGIGLSGVVSETNIPARDAEKFAPYRSITNGLTVASKTAALALVGDIRHTIRQARRQQHRTGGGSG